MDHTAVAAIQRSPAPSLDDVTVAQLRNEWAVLMEDAQRLMPTINKHAADMIEISRTLEAKKKVNFASGIRLDNGQIEFVYEEQIDSTAAKGRLQIPQTFTIGIAVLEGGPRYAVTARLRYRIGEKGALALWYDLERPHKVVEDAAKEVWLAIERDTGLRVFNGC